MIQFIKGGWEPGEARALEAFGDHVSVACPGRGLHLGNPRSRARDRQLVAGGVADLAHLPQRPQAKTRGARRSECGVETRLHRTANPVLQGRDERPELTHVALTGRGAPKELIERRRSGHGNVPRAPPLSRTGRQSPGRHRVLTSHEISSLRSLQQPGSP